jgi:hypothetical protein
MFMCRRHWFALPQKIRDAIWREYREGQEIDKRPSARYLAVSQLACAYSIFRPNSERAAMAAAPYLAAAVHYREAAISEGDGDSLVGLVQESYFGEGLSATRRSNAKE